MFEMMSGSIQVGDELTREQIEASWGKKDSEELEKNRPRGSGCRR